MARADWTADTASWTAEQIVFLDETSTQTVMTRRRAPARRGERAVGRVPLVFPGALDGAIVVQWLRERLLPTLAPGTTIVLDTLSVHRTAAARAVTEAAGCQLRFLPAYSPDLTPIELAFAKRKAHLRGSRAVRTSRC